MSLPDSLPPSIADLGQFETDRAIGSPALSGGAEHEGGVYRVSAAGFNIWGRADEFRFVSTRTSGDFVLSAAIDFVGRGADPHRKACLMARTDDSTDAAYVDVAVHGDGLISIQYRTARGEETSEVVATVRGVQQVELRRRGHYFSAWTRGVPITPEIRVDLPADLLVGIAVCSHRPDRVETVVFSDVTLKSTFATDRLYSVLEAIDVRTGARRPLDVFDRWVEAPNWLRDGRILFNCEGAMFERSVEGPITRIDTGAARSCNNDHGVSPDERTLAISDAGDGQSRVFLVPIDGGEATLVTAERPSYWHGFAPDGARITYTAERDGRWGIFTCALDGSDETRVTTAIGLDDGSEYSPDGEYIYFNSDRTGRMQIHRVPVAGGDPEQVIRSDTADWFPHVAPDGQSFVHLAYAPEVSGHPRDQEVEIVLTDLATRSSRGLAQMFGGQGTMNVPNWASDGSQIAIVSYLYG
jgi:TolB protein